MCYINLHIGKDRTLLFTPFTNDKEKVTSDKARLKAVLSRNLPWVPGAWIYLKELSAGHKSRSKQRLQKEKEKTPARFREIKGRGTEQGDTAPM